MIWRLRIHCLVMCVGLVAAQAQNDPLMTGNFLNGRWWQSLDSGQKYVGYRVFARAQLTSGLMSRPKLNFVLTSTARKRRQRRMPPTF